MKLGVIRSRPLLVFSVVLLVWLLLYVIIVLGPEAVHELRASNITRGCEEIKPGMVVAQALDVMHRRYQPTSESYSGTTITFDGYTSGCIVDLLERDGRVKSSHVDPNARDWFLVNEAQR